MIIRAGCGIITRMNISVLSTTNDIELLRTLALAMVQNTVSENAKKEEKLRQQRSLFEEDADIAAVEAQLDTLLPTEEKAAPDRPARKPLPSHQPKTALTVRAYCVTSVMK